MKAQFSLEFAIVLFFAVIFLIGLYSFASRQKLLVSSISFSEKMKNSVLDIASKINRAALLPGYSSYFYIPPKIADTNCLFTISNSSVVVECENSSALSSLYVSNITYNSSAPPFSLNSGYYTVKGESDEVIISEA